VGPITTDTPSARPAPVPASIPWFPLAVLAAVVLAALMLLCSTFSAPSPGDRRRRRSPLLGALGAGLFLFVGCAAPREYVAYRVPGTYTGTVYLDRATATTALDCAHGNGWLPADVGLETVRVRGNGAALFEKGSP
jgi:hypothetical protein